MVSNIETKPIETGTPCNNGGANKFVESVVAAKGWPSGIISGGKSHLKRKGKGKTVRKYKPSRSRSRKAGSCCNGGSKSKNGGGLTAMLGRALVPFGLLAAQQRTQRRGHRGNKPYRKKKSFRKRR